MNCPNNDSLLVQSDFSCVGDVAVHCDLKKLCIAIGQAELYDLKPLLCEFYFDAISIWNEVQSYQTAVLECEEDPECTTPPEEPENYAEKLALICGGEFEGCGGGRQSHQGLKRILVNYSYARYLMINGFNDTPTGAVQKTNEFSIPKPLKEVKDFSDQYRSMAYSDFKDTEKFICAHKDLFSTASCSCGKCKSKTVAKGYGASGSIIRKQTVIRKHRGGL